MRLYIILDRVLVHLGLRMDTRDSDQKRNLLEQRKKRLPDFALAITSFKRERTIFLRKVSLYNLCWSLVGEYV